MIQICKGVLFLPRGFCDIFFVSECDVLWSTIKCYNLGQSDSRWSKPQFVLIFFGGGCVFCQSNYPMIWQLTIRFVCYHSALRSRGEIGKTTDFVRRNIADMQKSFEQQSGFVSRRIQSHCKVAMKNILSMQAVTLAKSLPCQSDSDESGSYLSPP